MTMKIDRLRKKSNREVYKHTKEVWRRTRTKHFRHKGIHGAKKKKRQMLPSSGDTKRARFLKIRKRGSLKVFCCFNGG